MMIKLDTNPTSLTYPIDSHEGLETIHRLIVLVPTDWDSHAVTRQLWKLARTLGAHIQFLGLYKEAEQEPGLRRGLVTIASLLQDDGVCVDVRVELGTDWVEAVKRNYQSGDMIVCFAEQRTGLLKRHLSQILRSNLKATVYVLSGSHLQTPTRPNWLSQIMIWIGLLAIIVLAFLLQIRITSLPQDWAQSSLLILSVIGEIWLIWFWNSLFG
jgi:hypothetical protein